MRFFCKCKNESFTQNSKKEGLQHYAHIKKHGDIIKEIENEKSRQESLKEIKKL